MSQTGTESSSEASHQIRVKTRAETHAVTLTLIAEFADLPAIVVRNCAARAREELLRTGVRSGLPVAVEAMTRQRLRMVDVVRAG